MKKFLILVLMLCCMLPITAVAQMSDEEVISYVKNGMAAGKGEKEIGKELLARGVTQEQAERIQAKLEAGKGSTTATADQTVSGQDRVRHTSSFQKNDTAGSADMVTATTADVNMSGSANIYGHNIFNGRTLSFEPNENVATPENYKLGPGDQVVIEIWGYNEATITQVISPEGRINISQIGPIYLSGLTIKEASYKIKKALVAKYASIGGANANSEISVTLGQIRSIQVNILGDVSTPGTYRLSSFSTVFHALYRAGGVTKTGTLRGIEVIRNGKVLTPIDVYEYLFTGDSKSDIRLEEGDVVMVQPYKKIVAISGSVRRPMSYELKEGETLDNLIEYAGGFTGDAYTDDIRIVRKTGKEQQIFTLNKEQAKKYAMEDGDVVTISTNLDRFANRLEIRGHVFRPGMFQYGGDIKTVAQLVERAGGLLEDAYTGRAVILRETEDLSLETISFDLGAVLKGTIDDVMLRKNDVVVVAGIHELIDRGTMEINGFVANPNVFPFAENTTIEDLILQAGGLLDGASMARVDVARRVMDPNSLMPSDTLGVTYSFSIENGLAVGEAKGFILKPYDVVSVRKSPGYHEQKYVSVEGQVAFPGTYVLINEHERISDVIARAGGITNLAYLKGGLLVRRTTDEELTLNSAIRRMVRQGGGRDSVSLEKLSFSDHYTLGIDLEQAVNEPGSANDLLLNPDDRIIVPEYLSTVRIQGDVMYPNTVLYMEDKPLSYYIDAAGGYGTRAKKSKVYIVYMNGNVTRGTKLNVNIEPGCEIVVPSKNDHQKLTTAEWLSIGTTAASISTTIATIANLVRK